METVMRVEMETVMRAEMEAKMETEMTEMRDQMEIKMTEMKEIEEKMEVRYEKIEEKTKAQFEKLMCEMTEKLEEQETQLAAVQTRLPTVRDLPYLMVCAYRYYCDRASTTITYDSILSDYNNSDKPNGGDGVMDIETGTYTAITPGHYTVTFSGVAVVDPGEIVEFFLRRNGERVEESQWWSQEFSGGVRMYDQGSRTVVSGAVFYCIVLYCIVLYCIVLYCIVLYCIVLYCIVLYCIV